MLGCDPKIRLQKLKLAAEARRRQRERIAPMKQKVSSHVEESHLYMSTRGNKRSSKGRVRCRYSTIASGRW